MSVIVARIGTPLPGKQADALAFAKKRAEAMHKLYGLDQEVSVRLGGPVGQVLTITRHENLSQFETIKAKVVADTVSGKLPAAPAGVFASAHENLWTTA